MSVSVFMALSTVFHSIKILPTTLRFLTLFFQSYVCLIGPFKYIALHKSLPRPWYNPLTRLKAPTNSLTNVLCNLSTYIYWNRAPLIWKTAVTDCSSSVSVFFAVGTLSCDHVGVNVRVRKRILWVKGTEEWSVYSTKFLYHTKNGLNAP